MGMPPYPMMAAVSTNGIRLGINEMNTIREEEKSMAMNRLMSRIARPRLVKRLCSRYWVPLKEVTLDPVVTTL